MRLRPARRAWGSGAPGSGSPGRGDAARFAGSLGRELASMAACDPSTVSAGHPGAWRCGRGLRGSSLRPRSDDRAAAAVRQGAHRGVASCHGLAGGSPVEFRLRRRTESTDLRPLCGIRRSAPGCGPGRPAAWLSAAIDGRRFYDAGLSESSRTDRVAQGRCWQLPRDAAAVPGSEVPEADHSHHGALSSRPGGGGGMIPLRAACPRLITHGSSAECRMDIVTSLPSRISNLIASSRIARKSPWLRMPGRDAWTVRYVNDGRNRKRRAHMARPGC